MASSDRFHLTLWLWAGVAAIAVGAGLRNLLTVTAPGSDTLGAVQIGAAFVNLAVIVLLQPRGGGDGDGGQ